MTLHVMHDIETLSSNRNAYILSIGSVVFNVHTGEEVDTFYITVGGEQKDRHVSEDTMRWWMTQDAKVRADTFAGETLLPAALERYRDFLRNHKFVGVWSNGADFDNVILTDAYRQVQISLPWQYKQSRCMRTMYRLWRGAALPVPPELHNAHNALVDAKRQALHLHLINKELNYPLS